MNKIKKNHTQVYNMDTDNQFWVRNVAMTNGNSALYKKLELRSLSPSGITLSTIEGLRYYPNIFFIRPNISFSVFFVYENDDYYMYQFKIDDTFNELKKIIVDGAEPKELMEILKL